MKVFCVSPGTIATLVNCVDSCHLSGPEGAMGTSGSSGTNKEDSFQSVQTFLRFPESKLI